MKAERLNNVRAALGYIRVSTRVQVDSGAGLDAQRAVIKRWVADPVNVHMVAEYHTEDACSGTVSPETRPVLKPLFGSG